MHITDIPTDKIKRCQILLATLFLALTILPSSFGEQARTKELPKVLYINSYHRGYPWSDSLADSILETLDGKVELHTEYLDAKRSDFKEYKPTLQRVLELKYGNMPLAAVLTSDDSAFDFVAQNRNTLFKNVPVVTCGINFMSPEILEKCPGSTGVMEGGHPIEAMKLAHQLFPKARQIVCITDYVGGNRVEEQVCRLPSILPYTDCVTIRQAQGTSVDEVISRVKEGVRNVPSIIFYFGLTFNEIRMGAGADVIKRIGSIGPPVFVLNKRFVEYGALGGIVQDGQKQGAMAAQMVLEVISGTPVENIPPVYEAVGQKIFNYGGLKHYGLTKSPLISDAVIIGAPDTRINRYRMFLIIGALFIIMQTALITGLIRLQQLRNRTALELKEAKETAEVASKAKSEFLMMVSHEFRTPLNAIDGFTALLAEENDPGARLEYTNDIMDSSHCLLGIVNDILEYTNANSATGKIKPETCSIADHLAALVGECRPSARKKGLALEFHSFFPHSPCLEIHWPYLKLAVCKLLENSIKFSQKGRVQVVLDELLSRHERSITVSVIDQGPGFDEKQIETMMEIFSQTEDYMTREHTGMGLGLALCHRMVNAIGGTLECSSKPNEETIFKIILPV